MLRKLETIFLENPPKKAKGTISLKNLMIELGYPEDKKQVAIFAHYNGAKGAMVDGESQLVFAPIDENGKPILDKAIAFDLPCPPYCHKNGIQVITVT